VVLTPYKQHIDLFVEDSGLDSYEYMLFLPTLNNI
jgi:hypothetical protein